MHAGQRGKLQDIDLPTLFKQALQVARDEDGNYPRFVADDNGGHIRFNCKTWRPVDDAQKPEV